MAKNSIGHDWGRKFMYADGKKEIRGGVPLDQLARALPRVSLPKDYLPARGQPVEGVYDHHMNYLKDLTAWPTVNGRQLKNQGTEIAAE